MSKSALFTPEVISSSSAEPNGLYQSINNGTKSQKFKQYDEHK